MSDTLVDRPKLSEAQKLDRLNSNAAAELTYLAAWGDPVEIDVSDSHCLQVTVVAGRIRITGAATEGEFHNLVERVRRVRDILLRAKYITGSLGD